MEEVKRGEGRCQRGFCLIIYYYPKDALGLGADASAAGGRAVHQA